jgi:hypothetical protein
MQYRKAINPEEKIKTPDPRLFALAVGVVSVEESPSLASPDVFLCIPCSYSNTKELVARPIG